MRIGVTSEIGPLEAVICHTPGPELLAVTPSNREDFLYDDIIDLEQARREHHRFKAVLSRFTEVYEVRDLLEEVFDRAEVKSSLIERVMDVARSEPLGKRLMELPPEDLVSLFIEGKPAEGGALQQLLNAEVYELPPLPNLYFTRDTGMVVGDGVMIGSMRYNVRWTEELLIKALFQHHPLLENSGIIYDGSDERRAGYTLEGGDVHILRDDLVLIGLSERSTPATFDDIAGQLVRTQGVRDILAVILPIDRAMIHLDMVFTMVDREHCVVFPPTFIGPARSAVLHYQAGKNGMREMPNLFAALRMLDMPVEPIFVGGDRRTMQEREQWASGCNFVAVRPGVVLGYSRNEATYEAMRRDAGYRIIDSLDYLTGEAEIEDGEKVVLTFEGAELVRGGGGSRCMTLPVRRGEVW
ncbi:MAG TPA: arginine deiminase family protein [Longimicrobiales bacterium]|nr:arginine deiminase family protein [Longimicrobiales bacterium]